MPVLATRRDLLVMDLHADIQTHIQPNTDNNSNNSSSQASQTSIDSLSIPPDKAAIHRRRSSASQIIPIVSHQGIFAVSTILPSKRSPLAPLDPQLSLLSLNKDIDMPADDAYQSGRKSSITLTNATRPTPYVQRNLPRRYTAGQRRTSLPALHPPQDAAHPLLPPLPPALLQTNPVSPHELASAHDDDADIYSRLSTFTFGDARSPVSASGPGSASQLLTTTASSSSTRIDDAESVSPLDKTPRPSVSHVHAQAHSHQSGYGQTKQKTPNGWSSPSEDEEDRKRTSARSKMRAIDDGTRRPSLPSNDAQQPQQHVSSQQQQYRHGSGSGMSTSTDKGKGRAGPTPAPTALEGDFYGRRGVVPAPAPISPSSPTEGEGEIGLELDTDVDLMMSADDTDRRRRAGQGARGGGGRSRGFQHGMTSDRSSVLMSSDVSSVYGETAEADRNANGRWTQPTGDGEAMETDGDRPVDEDVRVAIGTGTGARDADRKDSARTWTEETGRRGSLPMDIPRPSSSSRASHSNYNRGLDLDHRSSYRDERDSAFDAHARAQAQLRRPSRSVDDDLQRAAIHLQRKASRVSVAASVAGSGHGLDGSGATVAGGAAGLSGPSSEPDMRGMAMAQAIAQAHLDAQAHAQNQDQDQNQNQNQLQQTQNLQSDGSSFNLNVDASHVNETQSESEPYQGLDLNYILSVTGGASIDGGRADGKRGSDSWSGRLSVGSSIVAARERERDPSWAAGWGISAGYLGARRQSTATVNDDTFLRFVKKYDYSYDERRREWTFMREQRTESDTGHSTRPGQEIWRCLWVGRYKVDRVHSKNADASKPLQVRLNIRHLPDQYTKASTRGGPLTFIHKHSRAQAFSIFRGHYLPQRHLKTSSSVLLAPKKVQEQFTSTRTTSKLSTHGLLDDKESGGIVLPKERDRDTDRPREKREREHHASGSGTNSATTSTTSVSGTGHASSATTTSGQRTLASDQPQSQGQGKLRLRIDKKESSESAMTMTGAGDRDRKGKGPARSPVNGSLAASATVSSQASTSVGDLSGTASSPDKDRASASSEVDTPVSRTHAGSVAGTSFDPTNVASNAPRHRAGPAAMEVDVEFDRASQASRGMSSIAETASIQTSMTGSDVFSSAISAWDGSSIGSSNRFSLQSRRAPLDLRYQIQKMSMMDARGSIGSLDEQPMRTSHAEAFATLEPPFIEYLRMHSDKYDGGSDHDSQPSRFKGLRKLFHPQPLKSGSKHAHGHGPPTPGGANVAVLEGHYTPPWLTMAARSKQEEQERVIKNLNDSFRDVGLLPSFKPNSNSSKNRSGKKGRKLSDNVFDQIPDDSLYMLLPMWPGETDPTSAVLEDGAEAMDLDIPLDERQYLLVYYVPNELSKEREKENEKEKHTREDKKRSRGGGSNHTSSVASDASTSRNGVGGGAGGTGSVDGKGGNKIAVSLSSFNVLARLVSYKDVNGSGIRVPTSGLAVTGPISDAINAIPRVRFQVDDLALILAFCASRERGVEVVPEGAEKLGLCLPRTNPDPDSDAPLSPLGRAAVEMAWLGALAVMGFGSVA